MKVYHGIRNNTTDGIKVTVTVPSKRLGKSNFTTSKLNPRLDLINHSPTGMNWGYAGSGPAQLALALLADVLKDDDRAIHLHQRFKFKLITRLKTDEWKLTEREIIEIVRNIEAEMKSDAKRYALHSDDVD